VVLLVALVLFTEQAAVVVVVPLKVQHSKIAVPQVQLQVAQVALARKA
jgi:hypothetical protein